MMFSRFDISAPINVFSIFSFTAPIIAPFVSPVITAVGGASPYPMLPSSAFTRIMVSSAYKRNFEKLKICSIFSIRCIFILLFSRQIENFKPSLFANGFHLCGKMS